MRKLAVTAPNMSVGRLVLRPALWVQATDPIGGVAGTMRAADTSAVLVRPGLAIVTERDLTRAWAERRDADDAVGLIATDHPLVIGAGGSIAEAAAMMLNAEVRHLIVRMSDGPPGIASLRAVMAVLLQSCSTEAWLTTLRVSFSPPDDVPELWYG